ncbi:MAG: acriflavin resistance protein [Bacteroidetes bacterium]|nr:acriflavin resistance protein [Bacteroidota bacterium]
MTKYLIQHPVSVFMAFIALFILGIVTYMSIPVSLLPDIPIPQITVQISSDNTSARELENTAVTPVRNQLMQVSKLRDIRSETRDGNAVIHLDFEYGANIDLAFIEVNEKIDAAMNYFPKEMERPRVVKASATDIPVFNVYLTLRSDNPYSETDMDKFIGLSDFSEMVVSRRFEQLPEAAMVDMSGKISKQVVILPNPAFLEISGITQDDIENTLKNNNTDPGSMTVRDGYYEYVIRFSSTLKTVEDIENIYIRKNGRIYRLKDMATVRLVPQSNKGMVLYNGKRAVVLSVIKQSQESMNKMQKALGGVIDQFRKDFPDVEFNVSQSQTELLDYTIGNLTQNLVLAFIFVFLVSVFFLKDGRSSLIIGISLFVSLVISLLFFYLFKISMNVVSLTGLILASGMMIDSSIIVTDNIGQYHRKGFGLDEAGVKGTNELVAPMLSSVLTTISVFVPLIFLSGIAGAIFFDQAFSVTVGLLVSYITGITFMPVLYKVIYSVKIGRKHKKKFHKESLPQEPKTLLIEKAYDKGIEWIFSHKAFVAVVMLLVFPLCAYLFFIIKKEKMPDIKQNEVTVKVDWNENIHLDENNARCVALLGKTRKFYKEAAVLVGEQQFMLNRESLKAATEAEFYMKTANAENISILKRQVESYLHRKYPGANVSFAPAGTIFEKIFSTGEADLVVEYYPLDKTKEIGYKAVSEISSELLLVTGRKPTTSSFQSQLDLHIDREKLLLYNVPYELVSKALRTAFRENKFATLRSQQEYLPILLAGEKKGDARKILEETLVEVSADKDKRKNKLPLSTFISLSESEGLKTIVSGKAGEYIPFYYHDDGNVEKTIGQIRKATQGNGDWEVDFSGSFFSNRKMIGEMLVILCVSILLMYFILAAQFEDFKQPLLVLLELPIDIAAALALLMLLGHTLNLMSAIGIVVTCGIMINDSILKVDIINQLRREGMDLMGAIHTAGRRRLKAILMTSLTSVVCMAPLMFSSDLGSELEKPLAIATIGGMIIGTPVSLFVVPLAYWWIYRKEDKISL